MTGGKYYNVRRTTDLEQALTDINGRKGRLLHAVADQERDRLALDVRD
jgi:hypothetical protein